MNAVQHHQIDSGHLAFQWSHEPCPRPLVVLHGLGDSAIHTYSPRFTSTALKDTPALFIDFPGFGEGSAREFYPATLEALAADVSMLLSLLHIKSAPIFAHSMGANVALLLARDNPHLVSQLILAEPLLQREQSVLAANITKHSEERFIARGYTMLVRATSLQAHRGDVSAQAFLPTLKMANPTSMHRAAVSLLDEQDPQPLDILQSLNHPVTVLIGSETIADTNHLEHENICITRVANAGHFMMVQQADATACAILNQVN